MNHQNSFLILVYQTIITTIN